MNQFIAVTIGVGDMVRQVELEGIASAPWDYNVMLVDNFTSLYGVKDFLLDTVCNSKSHIKLPDISQLYLINKQIGRDDLD